MAIPLRQTVTLFIFLVQCPGCPIQFSIFCLGVLDIYVLQKEQAKVAKQALAELDQAQLQLELGFTMSISNL